MLRSLFGALLGVLLIVGATDARALPSFTQLAPVQADDSVIVPVTIRGDFTSTGLVGFDLFLLPVHAEIPLWYVQDVTSDGGSALYQRFLTPTVVEDPGSLGGALFSASGNLGFRVTDNSGGTQGFSVLDLVFAVLPGTAPDDYIVPYQTTLYSRDQTGGLVQSPASGNITIRVSGAVPAPAAGVLILSGLGALIAVKRRRRV